MLPLIKAEFRKSGKKYTRGFKLLLAVISVLALLISYLSFSYGFNSDAGIFTSGSDRYVIENRLFQHVIVEKEEGLNLLREGKIDVFLTGLSIVVTDTLKSSAAGEEMKNYIKGEFERWMYEKYGMYAFPVMIRAEYLKREIAPSFTPQPVSEERIRQISEQVREREEGGENVQEKVEESVIKSVQGGEESPVTLKRVKTEYSTPDSFSPPSLISKMVVAFLFIIPSFFVMQVFSSSLAEDVRMRRMEVLLSTPLTQEGILFQKMLPYLLLAFLITAIPSLIFGVNGVLYMASPLLLLFTAQAFIAVNSRSYRELTFLILVTNLLVMVYLVLPSVFSGLPLSDVSPVTFLLRSLSGEEVSITDLAFSSIPLATISATLFYMTARSLKIENLYSPTSPLERFVRTLTESASTDLRAFVMAMASVFIALFLEFFLLFFGLSVPLVTSYAVIMLGVAVIEEFLKSSLIYPVKSVRRAITVALGFFVAEKGLLLLSVFKDYSIVLPGELFIFPLLLHVTSSLTFAIVSRRDWRLGYLAAVAIHFAYNYGTVVML
ncbi:MAG: hypothetical protein GXO67_02555 [Archaeoglobi archaeon]|nr:hypothetical protein [Archaeoglobi archaeon]